MRPAHAQARPAGATPPARAGAGRPTLTSQGTTGGQRVVDGVVHERPSGRQLGTSAVPVDLWLDARGRVRQESVRLALHPPKHRTPGREDTAVTSTTVLRFSDSGSAVRVSAPPAADTADVTGRMTRSGATAGWDV
ncbi:hypothetical protein [Streptomyces sp. NPDC006193]|uniref:hypothetical protein n=1 Tax=Streptomyces sp. NPDC006193 TaxID=3155717 RepID=UPI0033ACA425